MVNFRDLSEFENITINMQGINELCSALRTAIYEGSNDVQAYEYGFHLLDTTFYKECEKLKRLTDELFDKAREKNN